MANGFHKIKLFNHKCIKVILVTLLTIVSAMLFACNNNLNENTLDEETTIAPTKEIREEEIVKRSIETSGIITETNNEGDIITTVKLANKIKKIEYDSSDLEEDYNIYKAIEINLSDKNSIAFNYKNQIDFIDEDLVIKNGGVYVLTGLLQNGQIIVEDKVEEKVEIVLNNAQIKTKKMSAILSLSNAPILIRLANGSENYIGVNELDKVYQNAIQVNNTLSMAGSGSLFVDEGFLNAIYCLDVLTFISGEYTLFGSASAVSSNSCIIIKNGTYNILSGTVSFISVNDVNGYIYIEDGEFNIISKGYGLIATNEIIVVNGNIKIESDKVAVKSKSIDIIDGNINIKSMEDAIIASSDNQLTKENEEDVYIRFVGGETNIDSWFDGINSYGDIYFEGGKIYVSGPTRHRNKIISYMGKVILNGSDLIALGASKEVQDFGINPNQNYIIVYYKERNARQKDSAYQLRDKADNIIMSFTPKKDYRVAIITSDKLTIGNEYILVSRDKETRVILSDKKTIITE